MDNDDKIACVAGRLREKGGRAWVRLIGIMANIFMLMRSQTGLGAEMSTFTDALYPTGRVRICYWLGI